LAATTGVVVVVIIIGSLTVLGGTAVKYIARTAVISREIEENIATTQLHIWQSPLVKQSIL
jgi:hypothetical protein